MRSSVRLTALAAVACTAFAITACSSSDEGAEEPVFSAPTSEATTEATTTEETTTTTTSEETTTEEAEETESDAESTEEEESTSPDGKTLRNDNGTFRITKATPGPGAAEPINARYRDIDDTGFASVGVTLPTDGFNGIMQVPLGKSFILWIGASGLGDPDGNLRDDFARVRITAVDAEGNVVLDSDNDVETNYDNWAPSGSDFGGSGIENVITFPTAGDFTMKVEIQQPGYEKFNIEQPIKIVA